VISLQNKKIVAISCGETHTLALSDSGHLYSFGGNTCGQLGQFLRPLDQKGKRCWDSIIYPKPQPDAPSYSFMSCADSQGSPPSSRNLHIHIYSNIAKDRSKEIDKTEQEEGPSVLDYGHLMSSDANFTPMNYTHQEYGIEQICNTPRLVKSLLHRKVIKISSGGVHNICVVEPYPMSLFNDIYASFMQNKFTDIVFKGFYSPSQSSSQAEPHSAGSSDEEGSEPQAREKLTVPVKVYAHQCILAAKSPYFKQLLQERRRPSESVVIDFES